ncbi:MAG: type II toxin-antitoxin system VapC family toxin [Spirochaetia bacterium]|nr:type II toxin-antitoxin system VapC family toxin [Spirochaetia bacterium]
MAIDIAIDTNRYRDFVDAVPEAVQVFRKATRICVPFIVIAELRAGFAVGSKGRENERIFDQFLQRERVEVLMPTMETTRGYAHLFRQLREAGTPMSD